MEGSNQSLPQRDPHNVVFDTYLSSRKSPFHISLHIGDRWNAVSACQPARVIQQDDMRKRMAKNHLKFSGKPLLIALFADPSVITRIEPEERRSVQQSQYLGHNRATVTAENL